MSSHTRTRALALVSIYAVIITIALYHQIVRDISLQLRQTTNDHQLLASEAFYYEKHFLPTPSRHGNSSLVSSRAAVPLSASVTSVDDVDNNDWHSSASKPTFPIKTHIVTQGRPRTATTLLFNMVSVSYFLHLITNEPSKIQNVELSYWQRPKGYKILRRSTARSATIIAKTHISLDNFLSDNTVVFSAASTKKEAATMRQTLENDGHIVAFVQDMETLKEGGVAGMVKEYVSGYGLSPKDEANLNEYFGNWEILRQCCGQQMSARWRNDMMPEQWKISRFETHPTCAGYDIDDIEQSFMKTELYNLIEKYPSVQPLNKPSLNDGNLNGTYCSSYNYLVRTQGLSIWGQPGGRPVRGKLDSAIKDQISKGAGGLTNPEVALELFPETNDKLAVRLKAMWKRPEEEKKVWLKAVLAVREGGKSYADYGIESTGPSGDFDRDGSDGEMQGQSNEDGSDEGEYDGNNEEEERDGDTEKSNVSVDDQEPGNDNSGEIISVQGLSATHAVFLISFGEEAADSTLVERCILSLRRRGAWDGYIVLLTDAPPDRYQNEWDDNVIIMHPEEEHLKTANGAHLQFTGENTSLKSKRFKTFIIDYMDSDERLDEVKLIYYLDIDIMAGDDMDDLFSELENKYAVSQEERQQGSLSKLYFFTPLSKEWPLQGGTFIVERQSSGHCLELWRIEIDKMTLSGRGRDQDALRTIHQRIESKEETKCELVRMKNEHYITFPTPRTFQKLIKQTWYPSLIHISNSVFAKWIDEELQNNYIHKVLQLSEVERLSGKYGTASVRAKISDMRYISKEQCHMLHK